MLRKKGYHVDLHFFMRKAIEEGKSGLLEKEIPVGALLVDQSNKIIARDHNRCISLNDPTAHAEILVLRKAAKAVKNYRLHGMTMFATIEPCPMCMGAIIHARLDMVVFGAFDLKAGAAGSLYSFQNDDRLNHRLKVISGVMEKECRELIQDFFKKRR